MAAKEELKNGFNLGEVRAAKESDFDYFLSLCHLSEGWHQEYSKRDVTVHSRSSAGSSFRMFRVCSLLKDVDALSVYHVLHDPDYRKVWDKSMMCGEEICVVDSNNDVGYYACSSMFFYRKKDFYFCKANLFYLISGWGMLQF